MLLTTKCQSLDKIKDRREIKARSSYFIDVFLQVMAPIENCVSSHAWLDWFLLLSRMPVWRCFSKFGNKKITVCTFVTKLMTNFVQNERNFVKYSWAHIDYDFSLRTQENGYDVWKSLLQQLSYSSCCCPLGAVSHFDIQQNPINPATNRPQPY